MLLRFCIVSLLLLLCSCAAPRPDMPDGYSVPFTCSYAGFVVLRGWITVDPALEDFQDQLDLNYGLECESPVHEKVRCFVDVDY